MARWSKYQPAIGHISSSRKAVRTFLNTTLETASQLIPRCGCEETISSVFGLVKVGQPSRNVTVSGGWLVSSANRQMSVRSQSCNFRLKPKTNLRICRSGNFSGRGTPPSKKLLEIAGPNGVDQKQNLITAPVEIVAAIIMPYTG